MRCFYSTVPHFGTHKKCLEEEDRSEDVHNGIVQRRREQQAEEARSRLQAECWNMSAEEAVKTEKRRE